MSDLEIKLTHVRDALARRLEQFKGKANLEALLTALITPVQTVEGDLIDLYTDRWPDTAEGVQLDNLGDIVGQSRLGFSDAQYRLWIKARILVNRSTGLADDTLKIARLIGGVEAEIELTEQPPAGYLLTITNLGALDVAQVFEILRSAKPAGVKMHLTYSGSPLDALFRYDTVGQGYDGTAVYADDEG